jgi:hypothetical protein
MTRIPLGLVLGAVLFLATDALGDGFAAVGVYCVSVGPHGPPVKALRTGERQPQISFRVSNRSTIEDELRIYAVAPLNDEVFRGLAALSEDARVCLTANRISIRHGLDILLAWSLETCVDFECTNVPRYDDYVQGRPLRRATQAGPPPPDAGPSNREPSPRVRPVESIEP